MCSWYQVVLPFGRGFSHLQNSSGHVHRILSSRHFREELKRGFSEGPPPSSSKLCEVLLSYIVLLISTSRFLSFLLPGDTFARCSLLHLSLLVVQENAVLGDFYFHTGDFICPKWILPS